MKSELATTLRGKGHIITCLVDNSPGDICLSAHDYLIKCKTMFVGKIYIGGVCMFWFFDS